MNHPGEEYAARMEAWWAEHGGKPESEQWHTFIDRWWSYQSEKVIEALTPHDRDGHFGMSKAGGCTRASVLELRGYEKSGFSGSDQVTFFIGHTLEPLVLATLEMIGVEVEAAQAQVNIEPMMQSATDGIILIDGVRTSLSVKTAGYKMALALDTPIPTPNGWTTMDDIEEGDFVFDENGRPTEVLYVSPVYRDNECYRIVFDDGSEIVADADHKWEVQSPKSRLTGLYEVLTTKQLLDAGLRTKRNSRRFRIKTCDPVLYSKADLPLDPYTLGAWLGDGTSDAPVIGTPDERIIDWIRAAGIPVRHTGGITYRIGEPGDQRGKRNSFMETLRELDLVGLKHIPDQYLTAAPDQRLALLQGLMDTDGHARQNGGCVFSTTKRELADDVMELLASLGIKASLSTYEAKIKDVSYGKAYHICFSSNIPVFTVDRKLDRQNLYPTDRTRYRYIESIEPQPSVPVRCIRVASTWGLFLAGKDYIVTHNSGFNYKTRDWKRYGFAQYAIDGVRGTNPGYWAQMQAEMHGLGLKQALFVVVAKDMIKAMANDPYQKSLTFYTELIQADTEWVENSLIPVWSEAWRFANSEGSAGPAWVFTGEDWVELDITDRDKSGPNKKATGRFNYCLYCDLAETCPLVESIAKGKTA